MNRQKEAVIQILKVARKRPEVNGVFLKGSLAAGRADEYSDVDLYCLVKEDLEEDFLDCRLQILRSYQPVVYWTESNFVGPQIVAVYENGLHFDLYTVTEENFPLTGCSEILYDPENLLAELLNNSPSHRIENSDVKKHFHSFIFILLEFESAWYRGDMAWADRLCRHMAGELGVLLRHRYDPSHAELGMKLLERVLPCRVKNRLRSALVSCSEDELPIGVKSLCDLMKETIDYICQDEDVQLNWPFWDMMYGKIVNMDSDIDD